jgi:hypothetical protein
VRDSGTHADLTPLGGVRGVAVLVAVVVLVTAVWPLASAALPDGQPLAAGRVLVIGPDRGHSARFTVGRGWSMLASQSDPTQGYSLRQGDMTVTVGYVSLLGRGQAGQLWAGLRRIVQSDHSGSRLGPMRVIRVSQTVTEDTGYLAEGAMAGEAAVLPDLLEVYAIEVTILAPAGADTARLRAAERVIRSLRFGSP